jgi:hypothetical protein
MRVEKTNDHTIDVAALPSGVYLLEGGSALCKVCEGIKRLL